MPWLLLAALGLLPACWVAPSRYLSISPNVRAAVQSCSFCTCIPEEGDIVVDLRGLQMAHRYLDRRFRSAAAQHEFPSGVVS